MPSVIDKVRMRDCPGCRRRKRECDFPPRDVSLVCKMCLPDALYSRFRQRKEQEAREALERVYDRMDVPVLKRAPRTDEMLSLLMEEMGGVHQFVYEYACQIKQMAAMKPGHSDTVRAFAAVLKLVHENNKRVDENTRAGMTMEQVEEAMETALAARTAEILLDRKQKELRQKFLALIAEADRAADEAAAAEAQLLLEAGETALPLATPEFGGEVFDADPS